MHMPTPAEITIFYLKVFLLPYYYAFIVFLSGYVFIAVKIIRRHANSFVMSLRAKIIFFGILLVNFCAFLLLQSLFHNWSGILPSGSVAPWFSKSIEFILLVWILNGVYWLLYLGWHDIVPLALRYILLLSLIFALTGIFAIGVFSQVEMMFGYHKLCLGLTCSLKPSLIEYLNGL